MMGWMLAMLSTSSWFAFGLPLCSRVVLMLIRKMRTRMRVMSVVGKRRLK